MFLFLVVYFSDFIFQSFLSYFIPLHVRLYIFSYLTFFISWRTTFNLYFTIYVRQHLPLSSIAWTHITKDERYQANSQRVIFQKICLTFWQPSSPEVMSRSAAGSNQSCVFGRPGVVRTTCEWELKKGAGKPEKNEF